MEVLLYWYCSDNGGSTVLVMVSCKYDICYSDNRVSSLINFKEYEIIIIMLWIVYHICIATVLAT